MRILERTGTYISAMKSPNCLPGGVHSRSRVIIESRLTARWVAGVTDADKIFSQQIGELLVDAECEDRRPDAPRLPYAPDVDVCDYPARSCPFFAGSINAGSSRVAVSQQKKAP